MEMLSTLHRDLCSIMPPFDRTFSSKNVSLKKTIKLSFIIFLMALMGPKLVFAQTSYTSAKSGYYHSATSWVGGVVPPAGSNIIVKHTLTISTTVNIPLSVTILSGGVALVKPTGSLKVDSAITINGGRLENAGGLIRLGAVGGGKRELSLLAGVFTVSLGITNINGNVVLNAGSFSLTGGSILIDPNSGVSATSLASGKDVFSVASDVNCNVTGGTITFTDPVFSGAGRTLVYSGSLKNASWVGSTMIFGDSVNTHTSTSTKGFNIDTRATGSSYLELGHVIANGGTSSNRYLSGSSVSTNGFDISGNLTVKPNAEVRTLAGGARLRIKGNILNEGKFYDMAGISFSQRTGPNTVPQSVTNNNGKGKWGNSVSSPSANFTNLEFNNTAGPVAVTFNFGDGIVVDGAIMVSGRVDFINGIIDIGSDNQFIFKMTASATRQNGALLRGVGPGGGAQMSKQFPAGASSFTFYIVDNVGTYDYTPVTVNFSSNSFAGKVVAINVFDNVHAKMKSGGLPTDYLSRYWRVVCTPIGTHTASMSFSYLTEDIVGVETNMNPNSWLGTAWTALSSQAGSGQLSINNLTETTFSSGTICEITGRHLGLSARMAPAVTSLALNGEPKITVYPNPVRAARMNVNFANLPSGRYSMLVYNSNGQLVYSTSNDVSGSNSSKQLSLPPSLTSGIYKFIVTSGNKQVSQQSIYIDN